mgnify:CR=1 FL=1
MDSVAVYCGSAAGNSPAYAEAARQLGEELARRGYTDSEEVATTVETITFALPRDLRLPRRENPAVAGG